MNEKLNDCQVEPSPKNPNQNDDLKNYDYSLKKHKMNKRFLFRMYRSLVIWTTCFFFAIFVPRKYQYKFLWPIFLKLFITGAKLHPHYIGKDINNYKGVIFASNHKCFADSHILMSILKNPFSLLYRKEVFKSPFYKFMAWRIGFIPISFKNIDSAEKSFVLMRKRLSQGVSMLFFPEGKHVIDDHFGKFQRGIAYLARETDCPIVPVAIYGVDDRMRFSREVRDRDVYINNGEPIKYSDFNDDNAFIAELTSRIKTLYMEMHEKYHLIDYPQKQSTKESLCSDK